MYGRQRTRWGLRAVAGFLCPPNQDRFSSRADSVQRAVPGLEFEANWRRNHVIEWGLVVLNQSPTNVNNGRRMCPGPARPACDRRLNLAVSCDARHRRGVNVFIEPPERRA